MAESSGQPVISRRSRYFTIVESSYSLRRIPARSYSKPKPKSCINLSPEKLSSSNAVVESSYSLCVTPARSEFKANANNLIKVSSPEYLNPSNTAKSEGNETPNSLPRRYPSRVRISAVQNSSSCGLKSPAGKEQVPQESESRKRVRETLRQFKEIYDKVVAEGVAKYPGDRARPNLVAYSLVKGKNKDLGSVNRCVGALEGVEIGDTFHFKVELFLVGLHCHMQSNIDYVTRNERLVAASIVSVCSENYGNVRMSGDVMVCCGSGKERKDQKMEYGNLALKNNIEDGTPVRFILGVRDGKRITYVYCGLYLVEKHWSKRGNYGCKVFLFQLRRLEGQMILDINEIMKLINSKSGSKDHDDKHLLLSKCASQEIHPSTLSEKCKISSEDVVEDVNCFGKRGREEEEESQATQAGNWKKVKQTLQEFRLIYEKLAAEEEAKQKKRPKKKKPGERSRVDLDAYNLYRYKNKDLSNATRHLGVVPGVEVGDTFLFRVELSLLGLHCQLQADIDYIRNDKMLRAVSIASVRLEQYNSNARKSDVLLFCGSGGKNGDQKMANGNLALKNSIAAKTPVRVFYGFKKSEAATYVYYGLYLVERYWRKKDNNDHYVFMFRLRRLPGQPKLKAKETKRSLSLRSGSALMFTEDISRGKEKVPIGVVNTIDDECLPPINYITEVIYPSKCKPAPLDGCNCVNGCSDSDACACAVRNGGELPYNSKGDIVEAKPLIYECGPSCKCPPSCHNRASQRGIKFPLEVFKTETMGWGVRSRTFIPSGSFICEYVGEMLEDEEAQNRTTDEYLFAIGNNYYDEALWEGLSSVPCLQKSASSETEEDGGFTLDASRYGNVGKFINHSCTPNLYAQNLLYDHGDKRMPHVCFFACEDIPPLQELTYHYNYIIDDVYDSDGNIRKKDCYCGSIDCTGRLY